MALTEFLTLQSDFYVRGKKEEIWLSPLTKATHFGYMHTLTLTLDKGEDKPFCHGQQLGQESS